MPAHPRLVTGVLAVTTALAGLLVPSTVTSASAEAPAPRTPAEALAIVSTGEVGGLLVENSFVSSVGWVRPGTSYPSRVLLTNTGDTAVGGAEVVVTAPTGTTFTQAGQGATIGDGGGTVTWTPGDVAARSTRTLVLESTADTLQQLPTVVWRDISSTATVTVGGSQGEFTSHGPKVIPPASSSTRRGTATGRSRWCRSSTATAPTRTATSGTSTP